MREYVLSIATTIRVYLVFILNLSVNQTQNCFKKERKQNSSYVYLPYTNPLFPACYRKQTIFCLASTTWRGLKTIFGLPEYLCRKDNIFCLNFAYKALWDCLNSLFQRHKPVSEAGKAVRFWGEVMS